MHFRRAASALLLAATVLPAHALDFEAPGQTLGTVLQRLSEQTGETLRVSPEAENELIYVSVKDTDLLTLLTKISEATGLEWSRSGNTYNLALTPNARRNLTQETSLYWRTALAPVINLRYQNQTRKPGFDYAAGFRESIANPRNANLRLNTSTPVSDALAYILTSTDLSFIDGLEPNTRVVYSSHPTARQKRMPAQVRTAVDRAASGYRALLQAALTHAQNGGSPPNSSFRDARTLQAQLNRTPAKSNLAVQRTNSGYVFTLTFVDSQGQTIVTASPSLLTPDTTVAIPGTSPFQIPNVPETKDPLTIEYAKAFLSIPRPGVFPNSAIQAHHPVTPPTTNPNPVPYSVNVSPQTRQALLDPVTNDPLGTLVSHVFSSLKDRHPNIVALIPDDAASPFAAAALSGTPASLNRYNGLTQTTKDGYLLVRPTDRLTTIQSRTNRTALKTVLSTMSQNYGLLSIKHLTDYAISSPRGVNHTGLDYAVTNWLFETDAAQTLSLTKETGWFDLNIIGRLTNLQPPRTATSMSGLSVQINDKFYNSPNVPTGQLVRVMASEGESDRVALSNQATETPVQVRVVYRVSFDSEQPANTATQFAQPQNNRSLHPEERTERFPYGLPVGLLGTGNIRTNDQILAIDRATGRKITYTSSGYAELLASANFGGNRTYPASAQVFDEYVPVVTESINLLIEVEQGLTLRLGLTGSRPVRTPGSYDQMPASFRNQVQQLVPRYEENFRRRLEQQNRNNNRRVGDN